MAGSYKTPGVYIEEISKFPPSVAQVETAIPAFVGYTEKAHKLEADDLIMVPTRISSLNDYQTYFGTVSDSEVRINVTVKYNIDGSISSVTPSLVSPNNVTKMYYALQMYFLNGGGPCYIVSCGAYDSTASSPSDDFEDAVEKIAKEDEVTLFVFPDSHLLSDDDFYPNYGEALKQCGKLGDRFTLIDVRMNPNPTSNALSTDDPFVLLRDTSLSDLKYGGAYYPDLKTIFNYVYSDDNVTIYDPAGSRILGDLIDNDPPGPDNTLLYNTVKKEIENRLKVVLGPGSAMAGVYARVDSNRGVWKAPANESILGIVEPMATITDEEQTSMNVDPTSGKSVNAIRNFSGKGTLVWGARTLAGNDNEWRYISVRRFFNMAEESIKKATAFVVFEPNDSTTWVKVKSMIDNFLTIMWRQGALAGPTPEKAFFVKVGLGQTMTALDILEGRLIIEIGMAVVRPAEFIILRFSHKMQES